MRIALGRQRVQGRCACQGERFQHRRDTLIRQPIIAVTPLHLQRQQATVGQPVQMRAGGSRRDAGRPGQLAGRSRRPPSASSQKYSIPDWGKLRLNSD